MYDKSTGILIAILLGWCGGYRFYLNQVGFGIIYVCTFGLFGIGWITDIICALTYSEKKSPSLAPNQSSNSSIKNQSQKKPINLKYKKNSYTLVRSMRTKVVGVTYPCSLDNSINRQEVLEYMMYGKLHLEKYEYEGKPAFHVVLDRRGLDIGNVNATYASHLGSKYKDCIFEISSYEVYGGDYSSYKDSYYGCKIQIDIYKKKEQKESTNTVNK